MGLQESGWLMNIIRSLFAFFDGLVYSLIKWILFGIFDLANLTTNSAVFSGIYQRIYVILGIFMAFKLSFAFFKYIIDPESMTGKSEKSLGKIFMRTFVMLAVLVLLPTLLFGNGNGPGYLSRAQNAFLPTLPKIIFGTKDIGGLAVTSSGSNNSEAFTNSIEQASDDISITILDGFFAPSPELDKVCHDKPSSEYPKIKSLDDFNKYLNITCGKYYVYSYMFFVSTVVGVLVVALLLGITLSIAKRIFKLLVLQVIAPIPIMSLMDPKGSKDGAFSKWIKSLGSTFGDIFMKLGIVYLIVVFIHLIVNSNGELFTNFPKNSGFRGTYLTILLILGLIFFAKEAPKFIKESLGFKGDGGGLFDDVKAVGKAAGLVGGAAVGAVGTVGAFATNYRAAKEEHDELTPGSKLNFFKNVGSGLAGAIGHQAVTSKALMGKNGGIKSVMEAMDKRNARRASHSTLPGRIGDRLYSLGTGRSYATMEQEKLDAFKNAFKSAKDYKAMAVEQAMKKGDFGFVDDKHDRSGGKLKGVGINYRNLQAAMESKDSKGNFKYTYQILDKDGKGTGRYATDVFNVSWFDSNTMADIEDTQTFNYLRQTYNGSEFTDPKLNTAWEQAKYDLGQADLEYNGSYLGADKYGTIGEVIGAANASSVEYSTGMRHRKHIANKRSNKSN